MWVKQAIGEITMGEEKRTLTNNGCITNERRDVTVKGT